MERKRSVAWQRWGRTLALSGLAALFPINESAAQGFEWPEEPENLKVLPPDVKGRQLGAIMRGFARALGVRCQFCHAAKAGQQLKPFDLTTFDFASDDNPEKAKARIMITMTQAIKDKHLSELDVAEAKRIEVTCVTCHRGRPEPEMLEDVLAEVIEAVGVESAIEKYGELRTKYYGGFSYDFSAGVLTRLAEELSSEERIDEAFAILDLEIEQHPGFARAHAVKAGIYQQTGDKDAAIKSMEKAVAVAPDRQKPFFQRQLEALKNP